MNYTHYTKALSYQVPQSVRMPMITVLGYKPIRYEFLIPETPDLCHFCKDKAINRIEYSVNGHDPGSVLGCQECSDKSVKIKGWFEERILK